MVEKIIKVRIFFELESLENIGFLAFCFLFFLSCSGLNYTESGFMHFHANIMVYIRQPLGQSLHAHWKLDIDYGHTFQKPQPQKLQIKGEEKSLSVNFLDYEKQGYVKADEIWPHIGFFVMHAVPRSVER